MRRQLLTGLPRRRIGARVSPSQPQGRPAAGPATHDPMCHAGRKRATISAMPPTTQPLKRSSRQAPSLLRAAKSARVRITHIDRSLAALERELERLARAPLIAALAKRRAPKHAGGRRAGVRMPCGWSCGASLTARQMRKHFAHCPNRPA
jgi:hypothetical protein